MPHLSLNAVRARLGRLSPPEIGDLIAANALRPFTRLAAGAGEFTVLGLYRVDAEWGEWVSWKVKVRCANGERLLALTQGRDGRWIAAEVKSVDEKRRLDVPERHASV